MSAGGCVEATFRRTGRILHLHFPNGELIRTTPEHPFYVAGKGWTPAGSLKAGDRLLTLLGDSVPLSEVYDTGAWEVVYNLRVADHRTYFVGDTTWSFAAWAHNLDCTEVDKIIRTVFADEGLTPNGLNSRQGSKKVGNRADWANRTYLVQHLVEKIHQLYSNTYSDTDVQRVAEVAATRMLQAAQRNPQTATFIPQHHETFRPSPSLTVPPALSAIAHRQYVLTRSTLNGTNTFTPIRVNLNDGGWDVRLTKALGSGKVVGVYLLRSPNGAIYKVGKATDLVGRLERYASDWVARGIQVWAEVYNLHGLGLGSRGLLDPEMVLRGRVREDGWDLSPESGAADGTWKQIADPGTNGWYATLSN